MNPGDTTPHDADDLPPWPQMTAAFLRAKDWPSIDHEALARVVEQLGASAGAPGSAANHAAYVQDLAAWGQATAALLRAGKLAQVALDAVAEELESLWKGDAHRLWTHLRELLVWFLAWNYAPAQREQHAHWYVRIVEERTQIGIILKTSSSLRPTLAEDLAEAYAYAREVTSEETGLPLAAFPEAYPWTATQVVHQRFWPLGNELGIVLLCEDDEEDAIP